MSDFTWAAKANDIPSGEGRVYEVNGVAIALFNVDGIFHALDNTCIHRGGPLGDGICTDGTVTCPWHGWEYSMTTGECLMMKRPRRTMSSPRTLMHLKLAAPEISAAAWAAAT